MVKTFEMKFVLKFILIAMSGVFVPALALYLTFPKSEVTRYGEAIERFAHAENVLRSAITSAIIVESIFLPILVIFLAVLASHKIAGPIFRLQKSLEEPLTTNVVSLIRLRTNDQLQDSARSFNSMANGLAERFTVLNQAQQELEQALKSGTTESYREKVDNIGRAIEKFNL